MLKNRTKYIWSMFVTFVFSYDVVTSTWVHPLLFWCKIGTSESNDFYSAEFHIFHMLTWCRAFYLSSLFAHYLVCLLGTLCISLLLEQLVDGLNPQLAPVVSPLFLLQLPWQFFEEWCYSNQCVVFVGYVGAPGSRTCHSQIEKSPSFLDLGWCSVPSMSMHSHAQYPGCRKMLQLSISLILVSHCMHQLSGQQYPYPL